MDMSATRLCRRTRSGFVAQTLIFILITIGVTATATVTIYEAYQKYVVDPRKPSEMKRLSEENDRLKRTAEQLQERLWQEEILDAAQIIQSRPSNPRGERFPEERRISRLRDAIRVVDKALKDDPTSLSPDFDSNAIEALRRDLPTFQAKIDQLQNKYEEEHPKPVDELVKRRAAPDKDKAEEK